MSWRVLFVSLLPLIQAATCYDIVREYSGQTFFDRWDFYGSWDNLTLGDVWWLDQNTASQQRLAYIDNNGRAVMRVDNTTTVANNDKRNSVRITSQDSYGAGSLWIADITHLPWGCSVWPAFWTKGPTWPDNGEIDIIEAVNVHPLSPPSPLSACANPAPSQLMGNNQYALHTTPGCVFTEGAVQTGRQQGTKDCSQGSGCVVAETKPNSFNAGFNDAGGGVWATQFDVEGVLCVTRLYASYCLIG
ncbi:hypothetical protein EWM64_g679 [Hericium alpestre]|uniref:Uncharacterized protein n=1 Tax=Hericium alpestre TaxID=135208 RepID=A0A4Z0AAQ5_9AGAM|nr:hypothetical protein EWM64_g679 [Hericium alpestre]